MIFNKFKKEIKPFARGIYSSYSLPNPKKVLSSFLNTPFYIYLLFKLLINIANKDFKDWGKIKLYPCLSDKDCESGSLPTHYFRQDLYIAQKIHSQNPTKHADIGSSVYGFVSNVASFRDLDVIDIRPLNIKLQRINFIQLDFMGKIPDEYFGKYDSLSCLHALEHFGLGRYGDNFNLRGYEQGLDNLINLSKKGGYIYLTVPIGKQRIEFNAHRVFNPSTIINYVKGRLNLEEFSIVDEYHNLFINQSLEDPKCKRSDYYNLGIFCFTKI